MSASNVRLLGFVFALLLGFPLPGASHSSATPAGVGELEIMGQLGGSVSSVDVAGSYAYFGVGPRLAVADVSDRSELRHIGSSDVLRGPVQDVVVVGHFAYVADVQGMTIVDVEDSAQPRTVGTVDVPFGSSALAVSGDAAYVTGNGVALAVVSVADPARPRLLATREGEWRAAVDIAIEGEYAYLAAGSDGLVVVSIADLGSITDAAVFPGAKHAYSVDVSGDKAYVATMGSGLMSISVADPEAPRLLYSVGELYLPTGIEVRGSIVFLADTSRMHVFQAEPDGSMIELGQTSFDRYIGDVSLGENTAYVVGTGKLRAVSIDSPANPSETGALHLPGNFLRVRVDGDYAYLTGQDGDLWVIDVSDPTGPVALGSADLTNEERRGWDAGGEGLDVVGDHVYVATYAGMLHVVSVADRQAPRPLGQAEIGMGGQRDLCVVGEHAYVASAHQGLKVYSVADEMHPREVGSIDIRDAVAVHVIGEYAYLANGTNGLGIVSVADPAYPELVGSLATPGLALDVFAEGDLGYVADDRGGLRIVSVADRTKPRELGVLESTDLVRRVHASGSYAALGLEGSAEVGLVSVADPGSARLMGVADLAGRLARGIEIQGDHVYAAGPDIGLFVLRIGSDASSTETPAETATQGPTSPPSPTREATGTATDAPPPSPATPTSTCTPSPPNGPDRRIYLPMALDM